MRPWQSHPQGAGRACHANELATTAHRRLHALRVLTAIFGRGNLYGIGPRAALQPL